MTSKKLGALLRSVPPATARPEVPEAPHPAAATSRLEQPSEPPPLPGPEPAETEPEVPLQVLIPKHIRKQLAFKVAEEGGSLRGLILAGIRALGIVVTDDEIRDKRGRRNS